MKITFGLGNIDAKYGIIIGEISNKWIAHFLLRNYGEGLTEINFAFLCRNKEYDTEIKQLSFCQFNKRKTSIETGIELDYRTVVACNTKGEFIKYFINVVLDSASDFDELGIKEFEADSFVEDLDTFFSTFLNEYKSLNEIIEDRIWL